MGNETPSPELSLILAALRAKLGRTDDDALDVAIAAVEHWPGVLALAQRHRVLPTVWEALRPLAGVPDAVRAALQQEHRQIAQHNVVLALEAINSTRALRAANIPVIAFKGAVAAAQIHGELANRPSGDLDLLVPRLRFDEAVTALGMLGYRTVQHSPKGLQSTLWSDRRQVALDLHYGLPPLALHLDDTLLWQHPSEVIVLGQSVPTLSAVDQPVVLAVNAMKEYWEPSLHSFFDLALCVAGYAPSMWQMVWQRARAIGARRALASALDVCDDLFAGGQNAAPASRPKLNTHWLTAERRYWLFNADVPDAREALPRAIHFKNLDAYHHTLTDSPARRLAYWLRKVFTPNAADDAFWRLPRPLRGLYVLLRPLRLLLKPFR